MSNANNRRNKLKHISKRTEETKTKTERLLEESEMNEVQNSKTAVTVDQNTVTAVEADQIQTPLLWMLAAADIRESVPALANWSDKDLEPTIAAVAAELKRAGASIGDNTVSGIDIEEFNSICNSVLLVTHKREITDHLEKEVRIDVIDIIGSGLKDPELRTLVDNIVAKCYTQNVDPSDGDVYYEILDGFIDPVMDQMAKNVTEVIDNVAETGAQNAETVAESITHVESASANETVVESNLSNTSHPAKRAYTKQPLIEKDIVVEKTTDVVKASKVGGQNVTLTAMIDGKEVQVDEVHIRRNMTPYVPDFTMSKVGDSNVAFAAMDEFYEYRSAIEQKQIILDILREAGKEWYRGVFDHFDEIYLSMDGVNLSEQLTDAEITQAVWGHSHGPYDPTQMNWSGIISVNPGVKSMRFNPNIYTNPPKHLTGVIR